MPGGGGGGGASLFIATPDQINLFEDRLSATSAVSIYDEHALVVFCRHTALILSLFSSAQFKMVSMRSGKPVCAPSISQNFPQSNFLSNSSYFRLTDDGRLSLILSRKIV